MKSSADPHGASIRRSLLLARARDLSKRLDLPVIVTEFNWLGTDVELEIARRADGSIVPVKMLIGPGATDLMILSNDGVHGRCARYNKVIGQLRGLAKQLIDLADERRVAMTPGSPIVYTMATLTMLDERVARRETVAMANGAVRLKTLDREIAFHTRYYEFFSRIVLDAVALERTPSDARVRHPQKGNA